MTYNVLMGTLNRTHSLTPSLKWCVMMEVDATGLKGSSWKIWCSHVRKDIKSFGLSGEDAQSRNKYLSVLMAIFPGEPVLTGFIGAKDNGSGGDNWSYKTCKAPVKSSPPTNQHPTFYRPDAIPIAEPTLSRH